MRALEDLVSLLTRLPGIGRKSALRMAYYLLKADQRYADALAGRIAQLQSEIRFCSICGSYTETDPCPVCDGADRDRRLICVVEQPQDVLTIEASKEYRGLYHVLGGLLSPLDGVGPDKLRIASLVQRIREGGGSPGGGSRARHESHRRGRHDGPLYQESSGTRRRPGHQARHGDTRRRRPGVRGPPDARPLVPRAHAAVMRRKDRR